MLARMTDRPADRLDEFMPRICPALRSHSRPISANRLGVDTDIVKITLLTASNATPLPSLKLSNASPVSLMLIEPPDS